MTLEIGNNNSKYIEHVTCLKYFAKRFIYITLSKPHDNSISHILWMRKLKLREVKSLAQGHTANKQ